MLQSLVHLHTMHAKHCRYIDNIAPLALCSKLKVINVRSCKDVQKVSFLASNADLHTLDLGACSEIRDVSALSLCVSLTALSLKNCRNLQRMLVHTQLRCLSLYGCQRLSDLSPLTRCINLTVLDLSHVQQIAQNVEWVALCTNLSRLYLCNVCPNGYFVACVNYLFHARLANNVFAITCES